MDWRFWARPKQLPPPGDWDTWVIRAGRGFGKTRSGAGWIHERAMQHPKRWMALIARNAADARDYMIEGPGGLLKNCPKSQLPHYEPSKRRVTWPNGSWATIYTDEEPDQLRGFSGDTAWLDEFAKYKHPEALWDNLNFGMREPSGDQPRRLITTTPRPLEVLKLIEADPRTRVVVGNSYENRANLDPKWFDKTLSKYKGTRLGRQEIEAEILSDVPGALWSRRQLDAERFDASRHGSLPTFVRIIVAVDPSTTNNDNSNEAGIIVVALAESGIAFVLDDWSEQGSPDQWARKAVAAYRRYMADAIVAESNQGGEMVRMTIQSVDANVPVKLVHASRGKYIRAEPVSALYEQGRVRHLGTLPTLEDQMISFTPARAADRSDGYSPDRVDALVWGLTELFPDVTDREIRQPPKVKTYAPRVQGMGMLG